MGLLPLQVHSLGGCPQGTGAAVTRAFGGLRRSRWACSRELPSDQQAEFQGQDSFIAFRVLGRIALGSTVATLQAGQSVGASALRTRAQSALQVEGFAVVVQSDKKK